MRRFIKIFFLSVALLFVIPPQRACAIDPVTIAILAPIAIQAANAARPYVVRGMLNMGKGLLNAGKCMLQVFYLPYGLFCMIFLSPWGEFKSGLVYSIRGCIAVGKVVFHILLLPVYAFGLKFNPGTA